MANAFVSVWIHRAPTKSHPGGKVRSHQFIHCSGETVLSTASDVARLVEQQLRKGEKAYVAPYAPCGKCEYSCACGAMAFFHSVTL